MMPDRIGTIGNTHGVNASNRPAPKNVPMTTMRLEPEIICASLACSDIGAAVALPVGVRAETAVAAGSGHAEYPGHRRIADAAIGAALVAQLDIQIHRLRRGAGDRQLAENVAVVDLHLAKVLVGLHLAVREIKHARLRDIRLRTRGYLVLVQVVAVGDAEGDLDGVAVDRRQDRLECFVYGQEVGIRAPYGSEGLAKRNLARVVIACDQSHRLRPGLGGVTKPDWFVAALGLDNDVSRIRQIARNGVGDANEEATPVNLLLAEELVLVVLALRHFDVTEGDAGRTALVGHLVSVEVVAVLDGPVDLDRVAGVGRRVTVGFLRPQQFPVLRGGRRGGEHCGAKQ